MPPAGQPDHSDGSMLALYPPPEVARGLAIPGGLDLESLHLTVAYTGHAADVGRKTLRRAAKNLAAVTAPITGTISGHARFTGGDQDVIVALVDSPALEQLRADTLTELGDRGITVPADHAGYTPHITIAHIEPDDPDPVGLFICVNVAFDGALEPISDGSGQWLVAVPA